MMVPKPTDGKQIIMTKYKVAYTLYQETPVYMKEIHSLEDKLLELTGRNGIYSYFKAC